MSHLNTKTSHSFSTSDHHFTTCKSSDNVLLTASQATDTSTIIVSIISTYITLTIGLSITISSANVPSTTFSETISFVNFASTDPSTLANSTSLGMSLCHLFQF